MIPNNLSLADYQSRFFPGVLPLLDNAFNARASLRGLNDVYELYGDAGKATTSALGHNDIVKSLDRLAALSAHSGTRAKMQTGKHWPTLAEVRRDINTYPLSKLGKAFYHFSNPDKQGAATKRVYLHAATPAFDNGLTIMSRLLSRRRGGLLENPGFLEAKIAGPAATTRKDSIVVYFSTAQALHLIKTMPASLFQVGVPHGVLPLDYIHPGVGGADEPVARMIDGQPLQSGSYGISLADLTYRALTDRQIQGSTTVASAELKRRFLWVLLSLMEKATIDPRLPYLMRGDYKKPDA
jgi:hypothetical protein